MVTDSIMGIQVEENNTLSFGNFLTKDKQKINDFFVENDTYSLRTYDQATKLEKNTELALETVPGTAIHNFYKPNKEAVSFHVQGYASTIITIGLEPNTLYRIKSSKQNLGSMASNSSGKVKFSLDLSNGKPQAISVEKLQTL